MNSLGPDFDALLTRGALCALAVAGGWLVLVVGAVGVEARTRGRLQLAHRAGCPPWLRRWLLASFLAVFTGVTGPAVAAGPTPGSTSGSTSGPGTGPRAADHTVVTALDGLPLPDRATGGILDDAPHPQSRTVVVRPGDSLWTIARSRLSPSTPDEDVAKAVARLYAANQVEIGADPDRIFPGQRLRVPPPARPPNPSTPLSEDR